MGKISKVFGVGVKGSLEVFLNHDGFDAGDLIEGIVALHVTKPIETRGIYTLLLPMRSPSNLPLF